MQIAIVSTILAVVLFVCLYLGFRQGLRLGMQTARGQIPHKLDPIGLVKPVKPTVLQDKLLDGYANMMAYNGDLPKGEK